MRHRAAEEPVEGAGEQDDDAADDHHHVASDGRLFEGEFRAALIESEFRLPRYEGFLQLPDGLPIARIRLNNRHILKRGAPRQAGYVPGDFADTLWGVAPTPGPVIPEGGPV